MELKEIHDEIIAEITQLRRGRSGCIFLLEHGLPPERVKEVTQFVAAHLKQKPLVKDGDLSPPWRQAFSPLGLIAAEVGYRYGEDTNDYWPRLKGALDAPFEGDAERRALVTGFRALESLTKVSPTETKWTQHFNLISWPIAHAVFPVWLHEPLLEAVKANPHSLSGVDDATFWQWLEAYALDKPRLRAFLARPELAQALLNDLLLDKRSDHLSDQVLKRIRRDIQGSNRSKRLLKEARTARVLTPRSHKTTKSPAQRKATTTDIARLSLSLDEDAPALEILPIPSIIDAEPSLERQRVRPLGVGRLMSLGSLLRDGAQVVMAELPKEHSPLLTPEDLRSVPGKLLVTLQAISLDLREPMLFSEARAGGMRANQVLDRSFTATDGWWLLNSTPLEADEEGVEERSQVCGRYRYHVDATKPSSQAWLKAQGLQYVPRPRVDLAGSPSLDRWRGVGGAHLHSDTMALIVSGGPVKEAKLGALSDGVHVVKFDEGDAALALQFKQEGAQEGALLLNVSEKPPPRPPLVTVALSGDAPTIRGLRQKRLQFRASSHAPLTGLRATIRLLQDERVIERVFTRPMLALPTTIDSSDDVWERVLDHLPKERDDKTYVLEVDVEGLGIGSWRLLPGEEPVAQSSASRVMEFSCDQPHHAREPNGQTAQRCVLRQPYEGALPRLGEGVCYHPGQGQLGAYARPPERVLRQQRDASGAPGLQTMLSAYLAWTTAQSDSMLAEAQRHLTAMLVDTWLIKPLCGERWAEAERLRGASREPFGEFIARQLIKRGIARDSGLEERLGEEIVRVAPDLRRELGRRLASANVWLYQLANRALDADKGCEALAEQINLAYQAVLVSRDSADVPCEQEGTIEALQGAMGAWSDDISWRGALELLLPQSAREPLRDIDYDTPDDAWLASDVARALKEAKMSWSEQEVARVLTMWVRPRAVVDVPDVAKLGNERLAAKALRYVAVRRREAIGGRL